MTIKLTKAAECSTKLGDSLEDTTTAGLVEYGLRSGCLDSEYYLALRLQALRELALQLAIDTIEEGNAISDTALKLIDVERDVIETKRFSKVS